MTHGWQERFARLEERRLGLLAGLDGHGDDRLNRSPGPGRWSVLQVIDHLIRSEGLSLRYVRRKLEAPGELPRATAQASLRYAVLALALRSPFRFRAPAPVAEVSERGSYVEARIRWDEVRDGWRDLVAGFPPELRGRAVFRHSAAGRGTLEQCLGAMHEHLVHHERQIRRTLAETD